MFSFRRRHEEVAGPSSDDPEGAWQARSPGRLDKALSFLWLGEADWEHWARDARSEFARVRHRRPPRDDEPASRA